MNTGKIYLCAGHHKNDTGAVCGQWKEADLTIELRDLIAQKISVIKDNDFQTLAQLVKELVNNSKMNDVICDLHFNASDSENATGCEVFIADKFTEPEKRLANELCQSISSTLDITNRGFKKESESARGRLAMMSPAGINVLIEVCFMTNKRDMSQYQMLKETLSEKIGEVLNRYATS